MEPLTISGEGGERQQEGGVKRGKGEEERWRGWQEEEGEDRMEGKEREGEEGGGVGIISASADFQALSYMFYMCFLI